MFLYKNNATVYRSRKKYILLTTKSGLYNSSQTDFAHPDIQESRGSRQMMQGSNREMNEAIHNMAAILVGQPNIGLAPACIQHTIH